MHNTYNLTTFVPLVATILSCGGSERSQSPKQAVEPFVSNQVGSSCLLQIGAIPNVEVTDLVSLPDLSAPTGDRESYPEDAAIIVAIERYPRGPFVTGALSASEDWSIFFQHSLGILPEKILQLNPLDTSRVNMEKGMRKIVSLAEAGGRIWFVYIGVLSRSRSDNGETGIQLFGMQSFSMESSARRLDHLLPYADMVSAISRGPAKPVLIIDGTIVDNSSLSANTDVSTAPIEFDASTLRVPHNGTVLMSVQKEGILDTLAGTVRPAFSYLLIGALRGWGDMNKDAVVTAGEAIDYVNRYGNHMQPRTSSIAVRFLHGKRERVLSHGTETSPRFSTVDFRYNSIGLVLPPLPELKRIPEEWYAESTNRDCFDEWDNNIGWEAEGGIEEAFKECPGGTDVGIWANAWCNLSGSPCRSPYARKAEVMCVRMTRYQYQKDRIMRSIEKDWQQLTSVIESPDDSEVEKRNSLVDFSHRYPMLSELGLTSALEKICRRALVDSRPNQNKSDKTDGRWARIVGGFYQQGTDVPFIAEQATDLTRMDREELSNAPSHWVMLSSFDLLRNEVTVKEYHQCVDHGPCTPPRLPSDNSAADFPCPALLNYPVTYVTRDQADVYCRWIGARLPSEAEWEYAARSRAAYQYYPWGKIPETKRIARLDTRKHTNQRCEKSDSGTQLVCSNQMGNSEQGVCDLLGNVWEWVADDAHEGYCEVPADGRPWRITEYSENGIIRGGNRIQQFPNAAMRVSTSRNRQSGDIGFRCARDVPK